MLAARKNNKTSRVNFQFIFYVRIYMILSQSQYFENTTSQYFMNYQNTGDVYCPLKGIWVASLFSGAKKRKRKYKVRPIRYPYGTSDTSRSHEGDWYKRSLNQLDFNL
jgi:hypothetical protein